MKAEKKEKQNMSNAKEEKYRGIDGLTRYLAASPAAKAEEWSVRIDGVEISPGGWGLAALLDEAVFEHKVPPTLEQLVSVPEGVTVTLESVFSLLDKPVMRVDRTGNAVSMSLSVSPGNPELSKVYAVAAQIAAMPAGTQTHTSAIVGPHNVK